MIKTLCILPVLAVLGTLSAADAQVTDTTPPSLVSATVHVDTRVLTVEFDEPVEINSNYLGIFFIPLSEVVKPHRATVDSNIVTVTVSQTSVDIIEADGLVLGVSGAITDLSANAFNQHRISVTLVGASTPPNALSATLDTDTRILTIMFDEPVDVSTADQNGFFLADGSQIIYLRDAAVLNTSNSDTLNLELSQSDMDLLGNTNPTLFLDTDTISDISGNGNVIHAVLVQRTDPTDASSGGSSNEHLKRPTFGRSDLTHSQTVSCGYSMDGQCRDVLDYHVDYERETIQTGSVHDFTLRAYSPISHMAQFQIAFGVPEVGAPVSEAEAAIVVDLVRNYTEPSTYQVGGISYLNENNVIGTNATASVDLVRCMTGFEGDCVELSISGVLFREQMHHEPFVIYAMDRDRRTATHYMNEGIIVQGESLNPAPVAAAGIKKNGNQHEAEPINLVRVDKLGDLWEDQWGNIWTKNDHDTWRQMTPERIEKGPDGTWSVMTRMHSNFGALVQYEEDRAVLVWDSSEIQGVQGEPFAYGPGSTDRDIPKLKRLADQLASESSRAQALLDQLTQARAHHAWK